MDNSIERITELLDPVFQKQEVTLYEMKWTGSGKNRTLEIAIMKNDGTMDLDTCAAVSEQVSEVLDTCDFLNDAYMLEVCSPGAEREIRDLRELTTIDDPYVFIRLKQKIGKFEEYTGDVLSYENGIIQLQYRDKAATRSIEIPEEQIEFIRMAVKF